MTKPNDHLNQPIIVDGSEVWGKGAGWISVRQALPNYGVPVLVVYHGVVQHVTYSRYSDGWRPYENEDMDHMPESFVTHWMPLPAPPEATR